MTATRAAGLMLVVGTAAYIATAPAQTPPRDGASGYSVACALTDQSGMTACTSLPTALSCTHEVDFASQPSTQATGMTFVNRSNQSVFLFWIDFTGNRKFYRTLTPGSRTIQQTFVGHSWVVATSETPCVGIFRAPESVALF